MDDGFVEHGVTAGICEADAGTASDVHIGGEGGLNVFLAQDAGDNVLVAADLSVAQDQVSITLGVKVFGELCPVGAVLEMGHVDIQLGALHIQQHAANATAFGIGPTIGVAVHQDGGLGLQDGITAQDQVTDGAFAGGQVAIIIGCPDGCEVAVLVTQSVDQLSHNISVVVALGVLVHQSNRQNIGIDTLQVLDDQIFVLCPAGTKTECRDNSSLQVNGGAFRLFRNFRLNRSQLAIGINIELQDVHLVHTAGRNAGSDGILGSNSQLTGRNQQIADEVGVVAIHLVTGENSGILQHGGIVGRNDEGSAGLVSKLLDDLFQLLHLCHGAVDGAVVDIGLNAADLNHSMAHHTAFEPDVIAAIGDHDIIQLLNGSMAKQHMANFLAAFKGKDLDILAVLIAGLNGDLLGSYAQDGVGDLLHGDHRNILLPQILHNGLEGVGAAAPGVCPPLHKGGIAQNRLFRIFGHIGSNIQREGSSGLEHVGDVAHIVLAGGINQAVISGRVDEADAFGTQHGHIAFKSGGSELDTGVGNIAADLGVTGNDGMLAPLLVHFSKLGPVACIIEVGGNEIDLKALHIQQQMGITATLGVSPGVGIAIHQDAGLGLQDGISGEHQVAHGAVAGLQIAGAVSFTVPNRSIVNIGVIQSFCQLVDHISLIINSLGVLVDQRQDQHISGVFLQISHNGIHFCVPLAFEAESGQQGDIHLSGLELGLVGADLGADDFVLIRIERQIQSVNIFVTHHVHLNAGTQSHILASGEQVSEAIGLAGGAAPGGAPDSGLGAAADGIQLGGAAAQTVVRGQDNVALQSAVREVGEDKVVGSIQSMVAQDQGAIIHFHIIKGHHGNQRNGVVIVQQNREDILFAGEQNFDVGVADIQDLAEVRNHDLEIITLGKLGDHILHVIVNTGPVHAVRGAQRILQVVPGFQIGSLVEDDLLDGDLGGMLRIGQFRNGHGMVTVVMGEDPAGHHDLAVGALVEVLQAAIQLIYINSSAAVPNQEGTVSQSVDGALTDVITIAILVIQVDIVHLGSNAQVFIGIIIAVGEQICSGLQDNTHLGAVGTEGTLCSICQFSGQAGGVFDHVGQIDNGDNILTIDISSGNILDIAQVSQLILLVQGIAGSSQRLFIGIEVSLGDIVVTQHNNAAFGIHAVQEGACGHGGQVAVGVVHLADDGQGQGDVSDVHIDQGCESVNSGHGSGIIPTGNDQLAVDQSDDPLVGVDELQSLQGSLIGGTANQDLLLCISIEHGGGIILASLAFGAAEQHGIVRSLDLNTGLLTGSNTLIGDITGSPVTLLTNMAPLDFAVSLVDDFISSQAIGHDGLDLGGGAVDGDSFHDLEAEISVSSAGSHRSHHAQQNSTADDQHEPALLHHLGTEGQGDQASQRGNGQSAIDHCQEAAGLGSGVIITGAGSGGRRLSGSLGSGSLGGGGRSSGHLNTGNFQYIVELHGIIACQRGSFRLQNAYHQLDAFGNDQFGLNVLGQVTGIGNVQRDIDGVACDVIGLVSGQNCVQAIGRFLCGESGGAEHEDGQQEHTCQENR